MRILILLICLLLTSCDSNTIEGAEYTVIDYSENGWQFDNAKPSNLKKSEIELIEDVIREIVKKHTDNFNKRNPSDDNRRRDFVFYRQYVPAILPNGEKVVWINFICSITENNKERWKDKITLMRDGGPCFFQLKVNLSKRVFYDYHVNGIAGI